jgi:predicted flavoprotein YhiN
MQSKIVPGLYFAGEVLDLDGPIGGYNFQAAWSTGWLAGISAARDLTLPRPSLVK